MNRKYTHQFPSFEAAVAYLEERGTLQYFGRNGRMAEQFIYIFTHKDGRVFHVDVYNDGKMVVEKR